MNKRKLQIRAIKRTIRDNYNMQGYDITIENAEQEYRELEMSLKYDTSSELTKMFGVQFDLESALDYE
jgi:hypothetical protein|tara:strand:- start:702 stop:905 length:204 start_codon:yes stop_codon:yes gene_type:complete